MSRWPKVRVRDIATFLKGKKPAVTYDSPVSGAQPYILIENFNGAYRLFTDDNRCVACCPEDTLIVADGANSGLVSSGHKGFLGSTIGALRPDTNRIHPRFLFFYTHSLFDVLNKHMRGAAVPHLEKDLLLDLEIVLPPLADQEQIVRILDEADQLRRLRAEADYRTADLIPALFHDMFIRGTSSCPHAKLGEEAARVTKGESPGWQGHEYCDSGPVFITSENVLWGKIDITNAKHIPEEFHVKLSRSQLQPRDVLINLVGASIGRCCLVPRGIGPANINQAVACITPGNNLTPEYLCGFLLSQPIQRRLQGGKVEAARANISLSDLRELDVPLPSMALQHQYIFYIEQIRSFEAEQAASRRRLDDLFQSLLHRAFQGEL